MDFHSLHQLTQRLYREFDHLTWYYRVPLRRPVIALVEFTGKWGEWDGTLGQIRLAFKLFMDHPWDVGIEILKHEMAHQIVTEIFQVADQHGPHFAWACDMLGVAPWARRASVELNGGEERRVAAGEVDIESARLQRRAEKLLNLASSTNEHEALLAMQRVRELFARHQLESMRQAGGDQYDYAVIYLARKRIEQHQSMICNILNRFFFVKVIHTHYFDPRAQTEFKSVELIGNRPSVQMAEYVFHFLEARLPVLFDAFRRDRGLAGASSRAARRSYYLGVLKGFYDKLDAQRWSDRPTDEGQMNAAGTSAGGALMIVNDPGLERAFKRRFPRTRNSGWSSAYSDRSSFVAGREQGQRLNINRPIARQGLAGLLLK